jgi:dTDP-4-dehydrorhamnose reductase
MDKVLIIGGNSMIGKALADKWSNQNFEVHSTSRRFLNSNQIFFDLQGPNFSVFSDQYECIVFLAGDTNIQSCINNPILSEKVNVTNSILALDFFETISSNIIFISTDDVFFGSTPRESVNSPPKPKNLYGHQKALVERHITNNTANTAILRLSKVIHPKFNLFAEWRNAISQKQKIYPYIDKYFSPTNLVSVIEKISYIKSNNDTKIHHCSGEDDISYFDYALHYLDGNQTLIMPTKDPFASTDNFYSSLLDDCCKKE